MTQLWIVNEGYGGNCSSIFAEDILSAVARWDKLRIRTEELHDVGSLEITRAEDSHSLSIELNHDKIELSVRAWKHIHQHSKRIQKEISEKSRCFIDPCNMILTNDQWMAVARYVEDCKCVLKTDYQEE